MDTGKHLHKLSAKKGVDADQRFAILHLWFSPDDRFVLAEIHRRLTDRSGDESVEIAIWDTARGTIVQEIVIAPRVRHRSSLQINSLSVVAVSPDRRLIALARNHHSEIELWDIASATRRGILRGHEGAVTDLAFSRDSRCLASASDDTTVLVWDLNRPLHAVNFAGKLTEADVAAHWHRLADPDAARADASIWRLVKAKTLSIAFLKSHLRPPMRPDPMQVKRLIADLDSDDFKTRSLAQAGLERFGSLVLDDLKTELTKNGTLERQRRIQLLLENAERAVRPFGTPMQLREWRALEILERIGSPEAIEVLRVLATGTHNLPLTDNASEVLARLRSTMK
jgi:WD domain, G-beta repeat